MSTGSERNSLPDKSVMDDLSEGLEEGGPAFILPFVLSFLSFSLSLGGWVLLCVHLCVRFVHFFFLTKISVFLISLYISFMNGFD